MTKGKKVSHEFDSKLTLTVLDESKRSFEGWITVDVPDRQKDRVDPLGFTAEEYMTIIGGTIQGTHTNIPIGRWTKIEIREKTPGKLAWYGWGKIYQGIPDRGLESYPVWDDYWQYMLDCYKKGLPVGLSIGGDPDYRNPEYSPYIECDTNACWRTIPKTWWYETSVVMNPKGPSVPANWEAYVEKVNTLAKSMNDAPPLYGELMKAHHIHLEKFGGIPMDTTGHDPASGTAVQPEPLRPNTIKKTGPAGMAEKPGHILGEGDNDPMSQGMTDGELNKFSSGPAGGTRVADPERKVGVSPGSELNPFTRLKKDTYGTNVGGPDMEPNPFEKLKKDYHYGVPRMVRPKDFASVKPKERAARAEDSGIVDDPGHGTTGYVASEPGVKKDFHKPGATDFKPARTGWELPEVGTTNDRGQGHLVSPASGRVDPDHSSRPSGIQKKAKGPSERPNDQGMVGRLAGDVGHIHPPGGHADDDPVDDDRQYTQQRTLPESNVKRLGEVFPSRRNEGVASPGRGIRGVRHGGPRARSPTEPPKYAAMVPNENPEVQSPMLEGLAKRHGDYSPTDSEVEDRTGVVLHGQRDYPDEEGDNFVGSKAGLHVSPVKKSDKAMVPDTDELGPELEKGRMDDAGKGAQKGGAGLYERDRAQIRSYARSQGFSYGSKGGVDYAEAKTPPDYSVAQSITKAVNDALRKAIRMTNASGAELAKAALADDLMQFGFSGALAKAYAEELMRGETGSLQKALEVELIKNHAGHKGYSWDPNEEIDDQDRDPDATSAHVPYPVTEDPKWRPEAKVQPNGHRPVSNTVGSKMKKGCGGCPGHGELAKASDEDKGKKHEKDDENTRGRMGPQEGKGSGASGDGTKPEGNDKPQEGFPRDPSGQMPQSMDGSPPNGQGTSTHPEHMGPGQAEQGTNMPLPGTQPLQGRSIGEMLLQEMTNEELDAISMLVLSLKKDGAAGGSPLTTDTPGAYQARMGKPKNR